LDARHLIAKQDYVGLSRALELGELLGETWQESASGGDQRKLIAGFVLIPLVTCISIVTIVSVVTFVSFVT
jgi:hypothetical protein